MERRDFIQDTLIACAAEGRLADARRPGKGRAGRDALTAIIAEIDRTVLARDLQVMFTDHSTIEVAARNRRLHAITCTAPHAPEVYNRDLSPGDAQDVVLALSETCAQAPILHIQSALPSSPADESCLGVSTARLTLSAGFEPGHTAPSLDPVAQLLDIQADIVAAAYALMGGEVSAIHGADSAVEKYFDPVLDLLQIVTDLAFLLGDMVNTFGVILLPHDDVPEGGIALIGATGVITVAVFPTLDVAGIWAVLPLGLRQGLGQDL